MYIHVCYDNVRYDDATQPYDYSLVWFFFFFCFFSQALLVQLINIKSEGTIANVYMVSLSLDYRLCTL